MNSQWETSPKCPSALAVNMLWTKPSIIPELIFKIRKEVYLPLQLQISTPKHCFCFCHLAPATFGTSVFLTCTDLLFYHSLWSTMGETSQNRGLQHYHTNVPNKDLGVGVHQAELSQLWRMPRLSDSWTPSHSVHHFPER